MSAGWIKIHRKLQHSEVFRDPDLLRLWMYSLMKASHCDREIVIEGERVALKAGQFVTGRQALHDDYNDGVPPKKRVKDTTLWSWVKKLEKLKSVKIENAASRRYSIITILNWSEYQDQADEPKEDEKKKNDPKTPPKRKTEEEPEDMSDFLEVGKEENKAEITTSKKQKKGKREYTKEDIEFKLAGWLYKRMLDNNPNAKKPNPQKWSDVIRLMIERDNRKPEEIKAVIDWCQDSDFWMSNILSPDKLRKQYDTLYMQAKRDTAKKIVGSGGGARLNSGSSSRSERKNDILRGMMEKEGLNSGQDTNNSPVRLN